MKNFEKEEVLEVINEIYEEFVDDIIKKVIYLLFWEQNDAHEWTELLIFNIFREPFWNGENIYQNLWKSCLFLHQIA